MSDYECNNNDNDTGSLSVKILTEEIQEKLKEIIPSERVEEITSIAVFWNTDVVLWRVPQELQQPVKLLVTKNLSTSTSYEVKRSNGICCAYEVIHYSDGRPDERKLICCEFKGKFDSSQTHYYFVGHRSDNKCCIYVQDVINNGGNGLQLSCPPREWLVEK